MDVRSLRSWQLLAMALFVGGIAVIAIQLLNPSPIVVNVDGSNTEVAELSGVFTYRDVALVSIAAATVGATGTYLLVGNSTGQTPAEGHQLAANGGADVADLLEARKAEWAEVADRLRRNERAVYECILEEDGVIEQRDIVEETDLSKATVSRMLDSLESKQLVERKRRGMGNVVILQ